MDIKVGDKFYCYNEYKNHVVNTFIDGVDEVITYRRYSKAKKRWYYTTEFKELLAIGFKHGNSVMI